MSAVEVQPIIDQKGMKAFIRLPWTIYHGDPYWVPPLIRDEKALFNPQRNPFFDHAEGTFFLARRGGKPVGRIAAFVNHLHNEHHHDRTGFFGFFETVLDAEIAQCLFDACGAWLRARGMEIMRGPMNFSVNETCGLLIEGFDRSPFIMMPYNPRYYPDLLTQYGFHKAKDLLAFYIRTSTPIPDKVQHIAEMVPQKAGCTLRTLNMKDFAAEVERIKVIYNEAWADNWGAVPMTDREFDHLAKQLKTIVDPELVLIAEIKGEPAAFAMAIPDVNQSLKRINGRLDPISLIKLLWFSRKIREARLITLGVRKGYRHRGMDAALYLKILLNGRRLGYIGGELSWTLEDNVRINRAIEAMGGRIYKKYRIYDIAL